VPAPPPMMIARVRCSIERILLEVIRAEGDGRIMPRASADGEGRNYKMLMLDC
jgi:hypothetical protein